MISDPAPPAPLPAAARRLAFVAIALQLTVSANLLYLAGIDYAHPGGNPIGKFHPATWATLLALGLAMRARPAPRAPADLRRFARAMLAVMVSSTLLVGPSGVAVYVESYLAAGLFAMLVERLAPGDRLRLARTVLALVATNVALGLCETAMHAHLVPVFLEERALADAPGEFRPSALFDHPLTASAVTMTALLGLPVLRLPRLLAHAATGFLALGLLAWGERASLAIGLAFLAGRLARGEWRRLLHRRCGALHAARLGLGALAIAGAAAAIGCTTTIGERIGAHSGADGSTAARLAEWRMLGMLDLRGWLLGTPIGDFPGMIYKIGFTWPFTGIESFVLFALLDLGLFGFAIWGAGLFCFLRHLWRRSGGAGRMAIVALMLTASTSNSLGRKCNILFVLVALLAPGRQAEQAA